MSLGATTRYQDPAHGGDLELWSGKEPDADPYPVFCSTGGSFVV